MEQKCKEFYESRVDTLKDNIMHTTYLNPGSNRRIKQCSPAYNKMNADCNALITGKPRVARARNTGPKAPKSPKGKAHNTPKAHNNEMQLTEMYIKQWQQMPLIDPRSKKRIYPYMLPSSEYAILYKIGYEYYLHTGFDKKAVKEMLPREHILFGGIDVLYYRENTAEYVDEEKHVYEFLDEFLREHSGDELNHDKNLYFDAEYSIDEYNIIRYVIDIFVDTIAKYIKYMHMFFNKSYETFPLYVDEVAENRQTVYIIKYFIDKCSISGFDSKVSAYAGNALKAYKGLQIDYRVILQKLVASGNAANSMVACYDELFNIFNYMRDPDISPYGNLLVKVEDPIERMFEILTGKNSDDKDARKLYKMLNDVGVLDLLKKKRAGRGSLMGKDRKYFTGKCNNLIDPITQEKYDGEYPLAKMQLMYMLHTREKNKKKIKHTHCFYAPEFYNYVVSEILSSKKAVKNPLTNDVLTHDDIKGLVDVMKVVYPNIKDPYDYIDKKPFDTKLELVISHTRHAKGQLYCHMNIMRKLGDVNILVYKVCCIPKNMDRSDDFVKMIIDLFNSRELMYTYISPYYIHDDMYIKHDDVVGSYQEVEEWSSMRTDLQNRELTDYYNDIRKAFGR